MAPEEFRRKLTAILSADVEGYSRLMGEDEEATIRTLNMYKKMMFILIERNQGRLVDSTGDNLLAEFSSVVDSVRCAVQIQEDLKEKNKEQSENLKMEFRIGINLGDVIQEGDRIYGDGVNVAARIESLADGGGICISRSVYDQVKKKLNFRYEYLGEHEVKNIDEPVRVYKVSMELEAKEATAEEKPPVTLQDKASIAVLPFVNMSGDPEQEYFCDGITEEIITALSKLPSLLVIARNSTFTYKGRAVKVQDVGKELNVRYILEGSVRKSGNRVRITAQLIDTETGHHLWAERYDRDLKDIFALQDEITLKIIRELQMKLTPGAGDHLRTKGTDNIEAYLKLLQGWDYFHRMSPENRIIARKIAEEVIALDPEYSRGYALLSVIHMRDVMGQTTKSPSESIERGFQLAQKAIEMDESEVDGHTALGEAYEHRNQHELAIAEYDKALALNPNSDFAIRRLGGTLVWLGKPKEAIPLAKKAIRLNPLYPYDSYMVLGEAYAHMENYEKAIKVCQKIAQNQPNRFGTPSKPCCMLHGFG